MNNNKQSSRYVIFDIDGTLSDPSHRLNFALMKEWDKFNEEAKNDPVIVSMADLMRVLSL